MELTGEAAVERVLSEVPSKTGASEDAALYDLLKDGLESMLVLDPEVTETKVREMAREMVESIRDAAASLLGRFEYRHYECEITVGVEALTPQEAANVAQNVIDNNSDRWVFDVKDLGTNMVYVGIEAGR